MDSINQNTDTVSKTRESLTETEEKRTLRQILHEKLTEHTEKYAGTNTFTVYTVHQEGPKGTLFTEVLTALFDPKMYILNRKLTVF